MYDRFTDTESTQSAGVDFVVRNRIPPLWQITIAFLAVFFGIVMMAGAFPDNVRNPVFLVMVFILVGLLCWFTLFFTQRNRDMVIATEFQNALFSSAARINTRFCVIAKKDGSIVYYDPGFQTMFPEFVRMESRTIDMLLEMGGAGQADQSKVLSALERGVYERLIFTLQGPDGGTSKFVLTIDPLPRPEGFFLFRGREFVEQRSSAQPSSPASDVTPALVANLLHSIPVGLYACGADGRFQFVNRALEQWLGYQNGEMLSRQLALQDILPTDLTPEGSVRWENFQGEASLRTEAGDALKAYLTQEILRDGNGYVAGATGTVELDGAALPEDHPLKKKLSIRP